MPDPRRRRPDWRERRNLRGRSTGTSRTPWRLRADRAGTCSHTRRAADTRRADTAGTNTGSSRCRQAPGCSRRDRLGRARPARSTRESRTSRPGPPRRRRRRSPRRPPRRSHRWLRPAHLTRPNQRSRLDRRSPPRRRARRPPCWALHRSRRRPRPRPRPPRSPVGRGIVRARRGDLRTPAPNDEERGDDEERSPATQGSSKLPPVVRSCQCDNRPQSPARQLAPPRNGRERDFSIRLEGYCLSGRRRRLDVWTGFGERLKPQFEGCGVIFHRCEKVWKKTVPSGAALSEQN